jgi:glycosyltransferase involved in cell wall biosynthesis
MDSIIVPSEYLKRMLTQHWGLPANRVQVIYNSFEPVAPAEGYNGRDREDARAIIGLSTRYLLITVCRLTGWKGVDGLIRALPELGPEVGLVVVGDGPLYDELTALAEQLGVSDRVRFLGTVPRERVASLLRACDVFVLYSTYEGLPHVVLEAASAGLPVIATDAGGTREVVQDLANAQLVLVGNSVMLVEAIRTWIARLPVQPCLIPERFSLQHMVEATEAVLIRARGITKP